jgi:uncharacterized protein YecE (DUF72 family)
MYGKMIHIGTSGYSYQDWIGPVYPPGTKAGDMLELYAERFRTVEVNATYYRLPGAKTFAGMVKRAGPGFRFSVKLPGDVTHRGDLDLVDRFVEVTRPLTDAGVLACVLAQFPYAFQNARDSRAYVARLAERLRGAPLVVEFRHSSWQVDPVYAFLREHRLSLAAVDAPALPNLPRPEARATGPIGYLRFHGRNAEQWFEHERAEQRYDYLYTPDELSGWLERIRTLEAATEELFIYFNNHFQGKAATNALQLANLLGEPLPPAPGRLFS